MHQIYFKSRFSLVGWCFREFFKQNKHDPDKTPKSFIRSKEKSLQDS